ncbi:HD domain-containing phosphohydrolase [Paramicrobacterium fandaimingii]|uniref:HD domain-containing phosphohydrolase n=1 Tax=Paramicrobacterium fandaimingii TaxID=2708079 RepID=UPI00142062D8|nr:HD domain-containing phosphohydrolase [Microbacterium fandaimingii]
MNGSSIEARRADVLAGLSVAIDLGLGQPAEHMLRSAIIACRLADRLGLGRRERATTYYVSLLMWIGCHADSSEYARWFGDDIAVRRDSYLVDWSGLPYLRFLMGNVARGESMQRRVHVMATLIRDARGQLSALIHSHCSSASALARHIGTSDDVASALEYTFERFDGTGLPAAVAGDEIPVEMRVAQVADNAEVHHRMYGVAGAVAMVNGRRGGHFDPAIVDAFDSDPDGLFPAPGEDSWSSALALAPDADRPLDDSELDTMLRAIGDFADLKCPFALGHSRAVAELAAHAAAILGLDDSDITTIRRAAYVHDAGRLGVSNQIWSKSGDLTKAEWERVRMYPYLTDRVLSRIPGFGRVAVIARCHHEHVDGSGYSLGLAGAALGRAERLLAAADAYQSSREPRPYRAALAPHAGAERLLTRVRAGALDDECVTAVLAAAGHGGTVRHDDALTRRETEILGLVARGLSNREIATRLVISEKTVRNHVERTYMKIGATNRVGASLYALQHGLVSPGYRS